MLLATVAPSGGDYTTLAAAEAGEQADLDALGSPGEIECEAMVDTASVTIDGWTTSATNPLTIRAAAGHEPNLALTSGYRLQGANSFITINEHYVRWEHIGHLSTINSGTTRTFYSFGASSAETADFRLLNCVFKGSGLAGNGSHLCVLLGNNNSGSSIEVRGNVFYDWVTGGSGAPVALSAGSSSYTTPVYVHNNTFVNCYRAVICPASTTTIRLTNNLFRSNGLDLTNSAHGDSDYNATDAASGLPGANSRHSQTFTFVDEGADDFHLASGDAGAKGYGADLSAHAVYPFATDIDGDTITGDWSIGADWITAGAGGAFTGEPGSGTLSLTGQAPTIVLPRVMRPAAGALAATGFAATILTPRAIAAGVGAVTVSGFAPVILTGTTVAPGVGALAATGQTPTVLTPRTVRPAAGAITVTAFAPTVLTPRVMAPALGTAAFTGYAPALALPRTVRPGTGAASATGYAPTVALGGNALVRAQLASLLFAGYAPTVATTEDDAEYQGKYASEHASAFRDLGAVSDFSAEHASAFRDLGAA